MVTSSWPDVTIQHEAMKSRGADAIVIARVATIIQSVLNQETVRDQETMADDDHLTAEMIPDDATALDHHTDLTTLEGDTARHQENGTYDDHLAGEIHLDDTVPDPETITERDHLAPEIVPNHDTALDPETITDQDHLARGMTLADETILSAITNNKHEHDHKAEELTLSVAIHQTQLDMTLPENPRQLHMTERCHLHRSTRLNQF